MAVTLFSSAGVNLGNVSTDATGTYTSQGLPPGNYYVRTATGTFFLNNQMVGYIDQLWNGTVCVPACLSPTTGTPIVVTSGATTSGINFTLTAAGSVSGIVVDAGALTTGLSSIGIQIYTAAGSFAKATTTNTVGGYTVGGLPAGTYYARTSSGPNQFYQDELYREMPCGSGCTVTAGTPITAPPLGMASGVDFTLSSGAGSISGTVTDAVTTAALAAVTVQIYTPDGVLVKTVNTNIAGAFGFGGLTPGTYFARTAVISGSVYDDQVFDRKVCGATCTVTAGTAIVVAASATRSGVDFKLTVHVAPTMVLDRSALIFTAVNTGAAFTAVTGPQTVRMTQTSTPVISWTAQSNVPWLVVSPTSGAGTATLTISTQFASGLSATQAGMITIALTGAGNTVGPIAVTLNSILPTASAAPVGSFDTPADGATGLAGSVPVTGWTLDDVGVSRVTICRSAIGGETLGPDARCNSLPQQYIGDAIFIDGARPDVAGSFPTAPINTRAGWGYLMLTNFLPHLGNGTFTFTAYSFDLDGHVAALGTKTVTCNNVASLNPFGAIDTPAQGEVISGASYGSFGWVLSPGTAKADGADGGTVQVFVDGTLIGTPGGWTARPDLTSLFAAAQYSGISKALAIIGLDSTAFTNGTHTYVWNVIDTAAHSGGIGSRFIGISNGSLTLDPNAAHAANVIAATNVLDVPHAAALRIGSSQSSLRAEVDRAPSDLTAIEGRRGFDLDRALQAYTAENGRFDVQAEELDRIELHLGTTSGHQYSGYLRTASGLMPLPIGSRLEVSTGDFTWMPGVGFYGVYDLLFVRWTNGVATSRQDVRITLNAKGSNRVGPQTIIDVPGAGGGVFDAGQPFFLGGWAADLDAAADTGVATVHVWAYPVDANGHRQDPQFLGAAIYGGARPDVAAVYGDRFVNSGYGMIVPGLAPGTYDIAVFGLSTVVGNFTPAKVVRVIVMK
jgi:hypothetical protein